MADPSAPPVAVAAAQAVALVGMPEARLALAQVTIHLAAAPKSNAVITGVDAALADVRRGLAGSGELQSVVRWRSLLSAHASEHGVYIIYAGLTGFEGGKGMSGSSCAYAPRGEREVTLRTASVL